MSLDAPSGQVLIDKDPTQPLAAATKQYVDAVQTNVDAVQSNLDSHSGDTTIHWADAPNDGETYVRQSLGWVLEAKYDPIGSLDPLPQPPQFTDNFRIDRAGTEYRYELVDFVNDVVSAGLLGGGANAFTLGTGISTITGYTLSEQTWQFDPTPVNPSTGVITVPSAGFYKITVGIVGEQGNDAKEEQMFLWIRLPTGDLRVDAIEVATDKTDWRAMDASRVVSLNAGDTVSMGMSATAGMGTFTMDNCTLFVELYTDA